MSTTNDPIHLLPAEAQAKARLRLGITLWPADAAIAAISGYEQVGVAVVAVERWQELNGLPKWLAASDYDLDPEAGWAAYVTDCATQARRYIGQTALGSTDLLYVLSVMRETDPRGVIAGPNADRAGKSLFDRLFGWLRPKG